MGSLVYQYLKIMFGTKTTTKVSDLITTVFGTLNNFFGKGTAAHDVLQIFTGIAASLLVVFIFIDLLDKASKDMLTLEKLITTLIRAALSFAILVFLPGLLSGGIGFGQGIFQKISEQTDVLAGHSANPGEAGPGTVVFFKGSPMAEHGWIGVPDDKDWHKSYDGDGAKKNTWSFVKVLANEKKFVDPEKKRTRTRGSKLPEEKDEKRKKAVAQTNNGNPAACYVKGIGGITSNIGVFLVAILGWLVGFVVELATMFVIVSTALQLLLRTLFAPIAVVQCFDEGQRSTGIKYIKKFFATALTFAVIIGILYMTQYLSTSLLGSALKDCSTGDAAKEALQVSVKDLRVFLNSPSKQIMVLVSRFAAIGMIMGASRVANEIFGVY